MTPAPATAEPSQADIGPWIQSFTGGRPHPLALDPGEVRLVDVAHALSLAPRFAGHTVRPYSVGEHSLNVADSVAVHEYLMSRGDIARHIEHLVGRVGDLIARLRWHTLVQHPAVPELGRLAVGVLLALDGANSSSLRGTAWMILHALDHDASEAYLVDVPTPIKVQMPMYKAMEAIAQGACVRKLVPEIQPGVLSCEGTEVHAQVKGADLGVLFVEKARLLTVDLPDWSPGLPRDHYWGCIAGAVVSGYPGQLTDAERRMYLQREPGNTSPPPDPHSPWAVQCAFYHLHLFLAAVAQGVPVYRAVRDFAQAVDL